KYACSASPLMFSNGSTATEGLPGTGSGDDAEDVVETGALHGRSQRIAPAATIETVQAAAIHMSRRDGRHRCGFAAATGAGNPSSLTENARMGSAMFLTACTPRSSKVAATRFLTAPRTASDTTIPPGSASACSRAAMLTPSP